MLIKGVLSRICQTDIFRATARPLDDQAGPEELGVWGILASPFPGPDFHEGAGEEVKGERC